VREHDYEPVPGLPERLPPGETILWQGTPQFQALARRALHVRSIAWYFAALAAWRGLALAADGAAATDIAAGAGLLLLLGAAALVPLTLYAWAASRSTLYTITNRRVVIRAGVALPTSINVPFAVIEAAGLRLHGGGVGDIALRLVPGQKIAYLLLWPHARPWRLSRPEPMLRCIGDAERVAQILGRALAAAAAVPVQPVLADANSAVAAEGAAAAAF